MPEDCQHEWERDKTWTCSKCGKKQKGGKEGKYPPRDHNETKIKMTKNIKQLWGM